MKIDRYDIALINGACKSDEAARPTLRCLHLTKGRIEAADGFMLAVRDLDLGKDEAKPETLLPIKMLKQIKTSEKQQAIMAVIDGKATITYRDDKGKPVDFEPSLSFKTFGDGKNFPNTDQLWVNTEKKAYIAVNVDLLKKLVACLPNSGILRLGITDPKEPLEFDCSNMDRPIRGMIMPMYVEWSGHEWHGKAEAEPTGEVKKELVKAEAT